MNKNKIKASTKRTNYMMKKEKDGRRIINWICIVLLLLVIICAVYSMSILG
jgi:cell division protein FtsB